MRSLFTPRRWATLLACITAALSVRPFDETDVYWHLALGRAVLRHRARTVPEPMALDAGGGHAVASEWLWEVVASALHTSPGAFGGITAVTALCGAASAAMLVALASARFRDEDAPAPPALSLASAIAASLVLSRVRLRPESAVMVLLPGFVLLALRHARALSSGATDGRRTAVAMVALMALWAQVHSSTLVGIVAWGALTLPALGELRGADGPTRRRAAAHLLATLGGLVLAAATGAHGFGVIHQWRMHAHGDAVRHIADMRAPPLGFFDPRDNHLGFFFLSLLGLGAAGMVAARRVFTRELLLALPAAALVTTAVRGVGPGAVLAVPLAARGASALLALPSATGRRRWLAATFSMLTVAALGATARWAAREEGPLFAVGPRPGSMPHASARFLARRAPAGTPVLTSFVAGAPLGYWLQGRVRTLLDSRTPMHFSDADYGRARDIWRVSHALELGTARYGFRFAVVDREGPTCPLLAASPGWRPVVVEASFTTFARVTEPAAAVGLTRLAPCGAEHLSPAACGTDRGAALGAEIARMESLGARQASGFYGYLEALRVVRCGVPGATVASILARLPPARDAWVFRAQRDRVAARALASVNEVDAALDLVEDDVRSGDLGALAAVFPAARSRPERLRAMLHALSASLDDNTPGDVRAELAVLCAEGGDVECARFHGLRAAAHGSALVGPALCWLATHHPMAHVRRDAEAWRATLARAMPSDPRLRCARR